MPTTFTPQLLQSLQTAGAQADQARRQREMQLQQQQQQQQRQQPSINPNMLSQFFPKGGNTALGSTEGMTGQWLPVQGGLGGLGGSITAAPGLSLAGSGAATSGIGAGGTLGSFAGGGAAAGGSAAGGSAAGGLAAAGPWAALAAAVIGNETYAKNHGYRRDGADYYKDLATGRVLSQDVDKRWSPMIFGKNDNLGFGHDASFAADLGSFQFGKAFKDLKDSSLLTGFGLLG